MASVRQVKGSPYWIAKFREGQTTRYRSTKQKNRSNALRIALDWEQLAAKAHQNELTQAVVVSYANELLKRVGQESVGKISTKDFAEQWLQTGVKAESTRKRYASVITSLLQSLREKRSSASVASVTTSEIEAFRSNELSQGKLHSTADFGVKVLRAMFESVRKKNERLDNPVDGITHIPFSQQERIPFTDSQISLLTSLADTEWQGMILFGAFCGVRLTDAANIKWSQIDLDTGTLTFLPAKTALRNGRPLVVALHSKIVAYLKGPKHPKGQRKQLFPTLAGMKAGSAGGLSNQFGRLLIKAGIRDAESPLPAPRKGSKSRKFNELGFHSTRHYFISKLANADVPTDVRKAMSGHSPDSAHSRYVHFDLETQRRALEKIAFKPV